MSASLVRRNPFSVLIVIVGVAILLIACGQKAEEPASPALDAESSGKPAPLAQIAPYPASSPQPPASPEATAHLDQGNASPVLPGVPVIQSEGQPDAAESKPVDPHRLEELEHKRQPCRKRWTECRAL